MTRSQISNWILYTGCGRWQVRCAVVLVLTVVTSARIATSADPDFQFWFPMQFNHHVSDNWVISMQAEQRFRDNASEYSQVIYKPSLNYHHGDWVFSGGYKHIDRNGDSDEHDVWQEIGSNRKFDDLVTGWQVRLEERFYNGVSGMIPRLRFLTHASHPIGASPYYLTGFGAVRFNLDDKGQGPVSGFEQVRAFAGIGRHIGDHVLLECGYLYRFERERSLADNSDHTLNMHLTINTKAKPTRKPHPRDRYR